MAGAVRLAEALIPHALYLEQAIVDKLPSQVLAHIRGEQLISRRDLHRRCQGLVEIQAADDLDDPLERLEALYCVRVVDNPKRGGSGRPSGPTIYLNPKLQGTPNNIDKKDKPPSGGTPEPLSVDFVNENGGGVDELSEEDRQYLDDQFVRSPTPT